MNKQTRQTLRELAEMYALLQRCETCFSHIPARFKNYYLYVPPSCLDGLRAACFGLEELARQLVQLHNLPPQLAQLSHYALPKNSKMKK